MKTLLLTLALALAVGLNCNGQWVGLTNPALMAGGTVGASIGTGFGNPLGAGALNVNGHQMTPLLGETYWSTSADGFQGNTRFWRHAASWDPATPFHQMGRIFHNVGSAANANNGFNIQQTRRRGALTLMNRRNVANALPTPDDGNGLRLVDDFDFQINGYTINQRVGFIAIGDLNRAIDVIAMQVDATPWSRFHLVHNVRDVAAEATQYRPWMRNGTMATGQGLEMYVGHKYGLTGGAETTGQGAAVFQWGDDVLNADRQTARFIFTTAPVAGVTTGAASVDGLELMRMYPQSLTEGFVGIGDFFAAGATPLDRLDVLSGDVRVRELPLAVNERPLFDKFVVVDPLTGELRWRYSTGGGAPDCDWTYDDPNDDLTSAWDPGAPAGCPTDKWKVGIGTDIPTWKLHVAADATALPGLGGGIFAGVVGPGPGATAQGIGSIVTQPSIGLSSWGWALRGEYYNPGGVGHGTVSRVIVNDDDVNNVKTYGVEGSTSIVDGLVGDAHGMYAWVGASAAGRAYTATGLKAETSNAGDLFTDSYGVWSRAEGGSFRTYGVYAETTADTYGTLKYGVAGVAKGNYDDVNGSNIGVYGEAFVNSLNTSWAGYFRGNVNLDGDLYQYGTLTIISDGALKQNVQPIQSPLALVSALAPVSYQFNTADNPLLNLSAGDHFGFIAQDVQAVAPSLVKPVHRSAVFDSLGVMIETPVDYLGMNYIEVIPLLVGAIKEQQAQLAAMQQALDACCVGVPTDGQLFQGQGNNTGTGTQDLARFAAEDLLTIAPNPFEERTTISYRNATPGRVMLRVSDGRGQHIDTLRDAMQDAGAFTYEWNTVHLAPGMYTLSLLLDGQLLVERAVKVGR